MFLSVLLRYIYFFHADTKDMFGISCAPELFQKVMESVVAGLDGVVLYLDDIMVWGRNAEEHEGTLY